jgi:hypothetical protein
VARKVVNGQIQLVTTAGASAPWTIFARKRPDASTLNGSWFGIWQNVGGANGPQDHCLQFDSSALTVSVFAGNSGGGNSAPILTSVLGTWYDCAIVDNGTSSFTGYMQTTGNSAALLTQNVSGINYTALGANPTLFLAGDGFSTPEVWTGTTSDVMIWTVALTASEIEQQRKSKEPCVRLDKLYAYLPMDSNEAVIQDVAGNARHFTQMLGTSAIATDVPPVPLARAVGPLQTKLVATPNIIPGTAATAKTADNATPATSTTVNVTKSVNVGDTLIVVVGSAYNGASQWSGCTVSDDGGNTYVRRTQLLSAAGFARQEVWICSSATNTATTVSAALTGIAQTNGSSIGVAVMPYKNVASVGLVSTFTGHTNQPSGSLTTQDANNVVVGLLTTNTDGPDSGFGDTWATSPVNGTTRALIDMVNNVDSDIVVLENTSATPSSVSIKTGVFGGLMDWDLTLVELCSETASREYFEAAAAALPSTTYAQLHATKTVNTNGSGQGVSSATDIALDVNVAVKGTYAAAQFSEIQIANVGTLPTQNSWNVLVRVNNFGTSFNGYEVFTDTGGTNLEIWKFTNGTGARLGAAVPLSLGNEFVSGDKIGVQIDESITSPLITAYRVRSGVRSDLATRTDSTSPITSGNPGFGTYWDSTGAVAASLIDNWKGSPQSATTITYPAPLKLDSGIGGQLVNKGAIDSTSSSTVSVTVSPSGVQATGAVGTVLVRADANLVVTGVQATAAVGTVSVLAGALPQNITGVQATGAVGTVLVTGDARAPPTGVQGTGAVGTIVPRADSNLSVTGVQATAAVGNVVVLAGARPPITGVQITGAVGTVTLQATSNESASGTQGTGAIGSPGIRADANISGSGVQATAAVGTVTVDASGAVIINATGVQATGAVGTPSVVGVSNLTVTGVEADGAVGTVKVLAGALPQNITGVQITGAVGNVAVVGTANESASGAQGTGAIGSPGIRGDSNISGSGVQATTAVGTTTLQATVRISGSGVQATGAVGTVIPRADANESGSGVQGTGATGTTTQQANANVNPTGVQATGAVGNVTIVVTGIIIINPNGVQATGAVGTVGVVGNSNESSTGTSSTGAVGTPGVRASANPPITGVQATGAVGTVTVFNSQLIPVTGVQATGAVGTVNVQANSNISGSGVQATGAVGTVTLKANSNTFLTGVQATSVVGQPSVQANSNAAGTGVQITGTAGNVTVTGTSNPAIVGVQATAVAGSVSVVGRANLQLTGVSATYFVGTVSTLAGARPPVSGVQIIGSVGNITFIGSSTAYLQGVEADGQVGAVEVQIGGFFKAKKIIVIHSQSGDTGIVTDPRRKKTGFSEVVRVRAKMPRPAVPAQPKEDFNEEVIIRPTDEPPPPPPEVDPSIIKLDIKGK